MVELALPKLTRSERQIDGEIMYIDGYGNLFTNVNEHDLTGLPIDRLIIRCGSLRDNWCNPKLCLDARGRVCRRHQ